MKSHAAMLPYGHPSDWRRYLLQPIVPKGEGGVKPLSIAFPKALLTRIDKVSKETNNSRSDTIRHLLRWALDAYDKGRSAESSLHDDDARAAS